MPTRDSGLSARNTINDLIAARAKWLVLASENYYAFNVMQPSTAMQPLFTSADDLNSHPPLYYDRARSESENSSSFSLRILDFRLKLELNDRVVVLTVVWVASDVGDFAATTGSASSSSVPQANL